MEITTSLWFEVSIVSIIFTIGNIVIGHFEEQTPRIRRILKYLFILLLICCISYFFGRKYAFILLGILLLFPIYIHAYHLPYKKGINGWTGEPKSKYYDLRGWDKDVFKEK